MSTTTKMRFSMDSILAAAEAKTRKRSASVAAADNDDDDEADSPEPLKKSRPETAEIASYRVSEAHRLDVWAKSPEPSTSCSPEDLSCRAPRSSESPECSQHEAKEGGSKTREQSTSPETSEENSHRELESSVRYGVLRNFFASKSSVEVAVVVSVLPACRRIAPSPARRNQPIPI